MIDPNVTVLHVVWPFALATHGILPYIILPHIDTCHSAKCHSGQSRSALCHGAAQNIFNSVGTRKVFQTR